LKENIEREIRKISKDILKYRVLNFKKGCNLVNYAGEGDIKIK
jgi:hypothetical protein